MASNMVGLRLTRVVSSRASKFLVGKSSLRSNRNNFALLGARSLQSLAQQQSESISAVAQCLPKEKITCFADAITFMNEVKDVMNSTNPLFPLLNNDSYPAETRMSFVPYMVGFSCGFADFVENVLKLHKPESELTSLESKVNEYVAEDDFHYNYYLKDMEALGPKLEDFGTLQGMMRHVWCPEGAAARRVIYSLVETVAYSEDTRIRMLAAELVEAGLYALFTNIYTNIVKKDNSLPTLHYFGDTHISLEVGHTVTAQFSGKDQKVDPENKWMYEAMDNEVAEACVKGIVRTLANFDKMYRSFHHVILSVHDGKLKFQPERFAVDSDPPMANILGY